MHEPMTAQDFAGKIEREGGILEALDYGLKPEDAPEGPLRDAWTELVAQYALIDTIMDRVQGALDAVGEDDDSDLDQDHDYGQI